MADVKVYGADWCGHTKSIRSHLDKIGVAHDYVNIEQDARAREWVKRQNDGKEKKPTLDVKGRILSAPDESEVDEALREQHLIEA